MSPPVKILVADDDASARLLLNASLRKAGLDVTLAVDGAEALALYRRDPHDMVVLDVDMPGMDGYETCAALRAEAGALLPIVVVTGMDDLASIERAYESGATDFISKPINWGLLGYRVRYLLRANQNLLDLRKAQARMAAVLGAIPDSLVEMDVEGRIVAFHASRYPASQAPYGEVVGDSVAEILPHEAAQACRRALHTAFEEGSCCGGQFELPGEQGPRWFELSVVRKDDPESRRPTFIVLSRDVTERKEAEMRIARLAYLDSLTGLPNRQSFLDRVDREIRRAEQGGRRIAVLFLDLDGFKNVNDTMGHGAGDQLLQSAAKRLALGLRPTDVVTWSGVEGTEDALARLGGDEFAGLILQVDDPVDTLVVAHRLGHLMRRPFTINGRSVSLTTSIGIALYPDDGTDAATLLKHADTAMYHAKNSGRDNAQLYSASLTEEITRRFEISTSLRGALEREEFSLVYQPQIDVSSGRVSCAEALIRWNRPAQGQTAPLDFISIAEDFGLIDDIGRWVLRTACKDAAAWNRLGHRVSVAVNLSPVQFNAPELASMVMGVLAQTGLAPELLELEITEGCLMGDSAEIAAKLTALRDHGVRIALDDFGTGYSSLGYLTRMPINHVKVDRCFVSGDNGSAENFAIVRAIVALASSLGLRVTAEGVETPVQARALRAMHCRHQQGFLFSRPRPVADLPALFERRWVIPSESAAQERVPDPVARD